jgi:hypothetical protein
MGLLNFRRQNADLTVAAEIQDSEQPATTILPQKEEFHVAELPEIKGKENSIEGFFKINIHDIFKYKPEYESRQEKEKGQWVDLFSLPLDRPELDCFHRVNIIKYEDGHYDLIFISKACNVNNTVSRFINCCLDTFGKDFMGKGAVSEKDEKDICLGAFSRVWLNRARIENTFLSLTLELYQLPQGHKQ